MTLAYYQTLLSGKWLSDAVINYYLGMLQEQRTREGCRVWFPSTHLVSLLRRGNGPQEAVRWPSRANIADPLGLDLIGIPAHAVSGVHWPAVLVRPAVRKVTLVDSLIQESVSGKRNTAAGMADCASVAAWLGCVETGRGGDPGQRPWNVVGLSKKQVPQQVGTVDCGVFACMCLDFSSQGLPLVYSQAHVADYRIRMALSILRGYIVD